MESIRHQTYQPCETIVALSESSVVDACQLHKKLKPLLTPLCNLIILATEEKQLAGENRNRGSDVANGQYVVFMDSDDEYHPQKLELSLDLLEHYRADVVVHGFVRKIDRIPGFLSAHFDHKESMTAKQLVFSSELIRRTFGDSPKRDKEKELGTDGDTNVDAGFPIHQGAITVKKNILQHVRFTSKPTGEDGTFLRDILFLQPTPALVIATPTPLMIYSK
jgi:glycosyltransferase involved in cell wall biosynthesis